MPEAPESSKYHKGFDPSDPPPPDENDEAPCGGVIPETEREFYVVTIRVVVDAGTNVKNMANLAADHMQEVEGSAHVYDVHIEQEENDV